MNNLIKQAHEWRERNRFAVPNTDDELEHIVNCLDNLIDDMVPLADYEAMRAKVAELCEAVNHERQCENDLSDGGGSEEWVRLHEAQDATNTIVAACGPRSAVGAGEGGGA